MLLRNEREGTLLGVEGRFHNVVPDYADPKIIRNQKFTCSRRFIWHGETIDLRVEIRFDDELKNGHASFAITAAGYAVPNRRRNGDCEFCGCCHDAIVAAFPEFEPLIKWHLCNEDGPMHYPGNVTYHAGDRDCWGLRKGEESTNPRLMEHYVRFGNSPIEYKVPKRLKAFIDETITSGGEFILDKVEHPPTKGHQYGAKYQFAGMDCKWHECPFDSERQCRQFLDAVTGCEMHWSSRTNKFGEGKARDLKAARSCAIWPEATDEQLCSEKPVLEAMLMDRLPALIAEFKGVIKQCGLLWPGESDNETDS